MGKLQRTSYLSCNRLYGALFGGGLLQLFTKIDKLIGEFQLESLLFSLLALVLLQCLDILLKSLNVL